MNDSKIINDPIFGFIKIPHGLLLDIVEHPLMQRLTRIKQLGLTSMVYPSAPSDCHIQASSLPQARERTVTWSATMKAE